MRGGFATGILLYRVNKSNSSGPYVSEEARVYTYIYKRR